MFACYRDTVKMTHDERFAVLRSIGDECIYEDELCLLLKKKPNLVCYVWFEPSPVMDIEQVKQQQRTHPHSRTDRLLGNFSLYGRGSTMCTSNIHYLLMCYPKPILCVLSILMLTVSFHANFSLQLHSFCRG